MTDTNYNDIKTRLDGVLTTFDSEMERILKSHSTAAHQALVHAAFSAFLAADTTWHSELVARFGSRAGDVRYTKAGEMLPGYAAFKATGEAWRKLVGMTGD